MNRLKLLESVAVGFEVAAMPADPQNVRLTSRNHGESTTAALSTRIGARPITCAHRSARHYQTWSIRPQWWREASSGIETSYN